MSRKLWIIFLAGAVCVTLPAAAQEDRVAKAREAKAKGELDEAIRLLEQELAAAPNNASAHYVLAWVYMSKEEKNKAIAAFRKVVELDADAEQGREAVAALNRLGAEAVPAPAPAAAAAVETEEEEGAGVPTWAIAGAGAAALIIIIAVVSKKARSADLSTEVDWAKKGARLHLLGRYEESVACYDRGLELNPRDPRLWAGKGAALLRLRRHEEALACFDRGLELSPRGPDLWAGKGAALLGLGRHEEMLACFARGLELNPRNPRLWKHKATVLRALGREEEAAECDRQAAGLERGGG